MSGLTLRFPHHAHLTQYSVLMITEFSLGELVLGCVAGDGDAAFEGWSVLCVPIITNGFHPLQPLPWCLQEQTQQYQFLL
jgi:hypothetical protein